MRWRVQLGINSTSDVWKFCQNWTFIISMTKLDTSLCQHHILSPKPSPARLSTKNWCFCSYFHLVLLLKQHLVLLFVFSSIVPLWQFHFTFVFKIPFRHFVCFGKIINCTTVQFNNNCTPLNQSASSNFVMLIINQEI